MANIKSARKRARQAITRNARNASLKSRMRTAVKTAKKAIAAGKDGAVAALARSQSTVDRTARKGVIHRNTAARIKSRLARAAKSAG